MSLTIREEMDRVTDGVEVAEAKLERILQSLPRTERGRQVVGLARRIEAAQEDGDPPIVLGRLFLAMTGLIGEWAQEVRPAAPAAQGENHG